VHRDLHREHTSPILCWASVGQGDGRQDESTTLSHQPEVRHNQDTIDQCPTAEVEGELRSNGCNNGAVHAERRSVGVGGGASDIKDKRLEDAAPPVWMPPPRVTDAGSERKAKVSADSSPQKMEEGQEWDKDEQQRRMQQLPLQGRQRGVRKM